MSSDICGHTTADDTPCKNPASRPDDKCWMHTDVDEPDNIGRDSKLTKEREEQIAQAIESGKSITSAARMAGVSKNAVFSWIDKGESQDEGIYAMFHDRIARARGHGEDFYFELALQLARENDDHQFIASLMKQRYPDSWGETETGVSSQDIEISISEATYETWQ